MKQTRLQDQVSSVGSDQPVGNSRRVPLERKVILKFHHFGGFFIEYSANVSQTGMFIKTDAPKPPGSVFIFEIWLGDENKLVHGVGEVVWIRSEDDGADRPAGMGIRYLKIDDESRVVVQRVIREQIEKGGKVFDLAEAGSGMGSERNAEADRRSEFSLVDSGSRPVLQSGQLVLDEDLLDSDGQSTEEASHQDVPPLLAAPGPGRGLRRIALLLICLGVVMGGVAYLVSADLLPF
jgi:uncharacterized protein (TIGR02266 family)